MREDSLPKFIFAYFTTTRYLKTVKGPSQICTLRGRSRARTRQLECATRKPRPSCRSWTAALRCRACSKQVSRTPVLEFKTEVVNSLVPGLLGRQRQGLRHREQAKRIAAPGRRYCLVMDRTTVMLYSQQACNEASHGGRHGTEYCGRNR